MGKVIGVSTAFVVVLAAVGYFLIMSGGKPIGSDLSVVGKGKPTLVLGYENYSPTGGNALNRLRKVRSEFDARLEFAVADLGTPDGRAFADRYQLFDGVAVFLTQDGQPLKLTGIADDKQALRAEIESMLAAVE